MNLLEEIETLAVVRQSNHVNMLALMTAKQERDEPVRQFAARLRVLEAVCDLTVTCTCELKVSEVNKWVLIRVFHKYENCSKTFSQVVNGFHYVLGGTKKMSREFDHF